MEDILLYPSQTAHILPGRTCAACLLLLSDQAFWEMRGMEAHEEPLIPKSKVGHFQCAEFTGKEPVFQKE